MYRGPKHPAASSSETEATSALKRELFNFCNVLSFLEQRADALENKADRVEDAGAAQAKADKQAGKDAAKVDKAAADAQAEALKKAADQTREQK